MNTALRLLHGLEDVLLYLLVLLLVGLSVYQIFLRNAFDSGIYWADPLLRVCVLWLAMIGAMLASRERAHIRIDVLSHYMQGRALAWSGAATALFSALVCFIAAYYGILFVADEREYGGVAFASVPAWICQVIIPVGLGIIGLRFLLESAIQLRRRENVV